MNLFDNPFYILGAKMTDSPERILELEEEASLVRDPQECAQARLILTNPSRRLEAEVAWLPGIANEKIAEIITLLEANLPVKTDDINSLCIANILAESFVRTGTPIVEASIIYDVASNFCEAYSDDILTKINRLRQQAGIPLVKTIEEFEKQLQAHEENIGEVIARYLSSTEFEKYESLVDELISFYETDDEPPLSVTQKVLDQYEIKILPLLERLERQVDSAVTGLEVAAKKNDRQSIEQSLENLSEFLDQWYFKVDVLRRRYVLTGTAFKKDENLANRLRNKTVILFNETGNVDIAKRVTELLCENFPELPGFTEQLDEDKESLESINGNLSSDDASALEFGMKAIEEIRKNPIKGNELAIQLLAKIPAAADEISLPGNGSKTINLKDSLINICLNCIVSYCNATKNWSAATSVLAKLMGYTKEPETLNRIKINSKIINDNIQNNSVSFIKYIPIIAFLIFLLYTCSH